MDMVASVTRDMLPHMYERKSDMIIWRPYRLIAHFPANCRSTGIATIRLVISSV